MLVAPLGSGEADLEHWQKQEKDGWSDSLHAGPVRTLPHRSLNSQLTKLPLPY